MLHVTDSSFDKDVLKSAVPVVLDFWAEWCGPCKAIAPMLEEIQAELGSKVIIGKMNVDENSQIPAQFGIRGIPTLMLFKNGQMVSTQVGLSTKTKLVEWIQSGI
jgi:thioredoxin 1